MKIKHLLVSTMLLLTAVSQAQIAPTVRTQGGCSAGYGDNITVAGPGRIQQLNITNNVPSENIVVNMSQQGLYEISTNSTGPFQKTNLTLSGTNITVYVRANPRYEDMGTSSANSIGFYNISSPNISTNFDQSYSSVAANLNIPNPQMSIPSNLVLSQFQLETVTGFVDITVPNVVGGVALTVVGTTDDFNFLSPTNTNAFKAFQYIKISTTAGMDFINTPSSFNLPSNFSGRLQFQAHVPASESVKPYILLFTASGTNLISRTFIVRCGSENAKINPLSISGINNTLAINTISGFDVKQFTITGAGVGNGYTIETPTWIGASSTLSSNINDYITRPNNARLSIANTGGIVYLANISTSPNENNAAIEVRQFVNGAPDFSNLVRVSGTSTRTVESLTISNPILETETDPFSVITGLKSNETIFKNPLGISSNSIALTVVGNFLNQPITVSGILQQQFSSNLIDNGYRVSLTANGSLSENVVLPASGGVVYIKHDASLPNATLLLDSGEDQVEAINISSGTQASLKIKFNVTVLGMPQIKVSSTRNPFNNIGFRLGNNAFNYSLSFYFPRDIIPVHSFSLSGENLISPITLTSDFANISTSETSGFTNTLVANMGDIIYTKLIPGDNNGTPTYNSYEITALATNNAKTLINFESNPGISSTTPHIYLPVTNIDFENRILSQGRRRRNEFVDNYAVVEVKGFSLSDPITLTGTFLTKVSTSGPATWSSKAILPATGGELYVAIDKQFVGQYCGSIEVKSGTFTGTINIKDYANVITTLAGVTDNPTTDLASSLQTSPNILTIYPNPSNGEFKMENGKTVTIYDLLGKVILSTSESTFTIASKGIFIAKVQTSFGMKYVKLAVE